MVRNDAQVLQTLLYINTDCTAAAPHADNERRPETVIEDSNAQAERILNQVVFCDEYFLRLVLNVREPLINCLQLASRWGMMATCPYV